MDFQDRIDRFARFIGKAELCEEYPLLKVAKVGPVKQKRIATAVNYFLWTCLTSNFKDKSFDLLPDMLASYPEELQQLPNVTPNGLVLPKKDNQLAYNMVHTYVSDAFKDLRLDEHVDRIQIPVNIRLQSGRIDPSIDDRPHASTKPHCDFWAGDPAAGISVFLAVLGDTDKVGMRYWQPKDFPESLLRPLDDFMQGQALLETATEYPCRFRHGSFVLVDSFVIHQTVKSGSGLRLSLDFRFVARERVASDWDEDASRRKYFIPIEEWHDFGRGRLLTTEEPLTSFTGGDRMTVGYPVDFDVKMLGSGGVAVDDA